MANEQVWWIDATGGQINLNDWINYMCTRERGGMWAPPYTLSSTRMPLSEGSQFRDAVVEERGVDLKQKVRADSRDQLRALLRDLSRRMNPRLGQGSVSNPGLGQLKIVNGNDVRVLNCYPWGIKEPVDHGTSAELVLSFTAYDPCWYDEDPIITTVENTSVVAPFFSSIWFPLRLVGSLNYALRTMVNPGDADSYPIWTITGPGDTIILRNLTSGKSLSMGTLALNPGQILKIDTREGIKTVLLDGLNAMKSMTILSSLWNLMPGNNQVQIQMSNTTPYSLITVEYTPRYLSA